MKLLDDILQFNKRFVESGEYIQFFSDKYPEKKLAILSCMDTRIMELLYAAMGLKNGDAKVIRNAGAVVLHPWGSVMRSLLVAVFDLNVEEIMVVAHHDCGMCGFSPKHLLDKARAAGISDESINTLRHAGIDLDGWLTGFDNADDSVRHTVQMIRQHPLMPDYVAVHGMVIHPTTGKLTLVVNGNEADAG
ncbi:carbonic anhydrase [Eikenella sp. Marseille-P7795]|uniref:beta-class carbonic anhydrase n=1 Tax=Eikenella sp. Marseille-P7795 TaxID=2866577 RepID=UPI001CE42FA5|nr:carbonic anhydrase [Eikenella sp. Marseille-P7795]